MAGSGGFRCSGREEAELGMIMKTCLIFTMCEIAVTMREKKKKNGNYCLSAFLSLITEINAFF